MCKKCTLQLQNKEFDKKSTISKMEIVQIHYYNQKFCQGSENFSKKL